MRTESKIWTKRELATWLETLISHELQLSVDEVRQVRRFDALGVDSLLAALISAELQDKIGRQVGVDAIYEHGDFYALADRMGA